MEFTEKELDIIKESLSYTKKNIRNYGSYPSYEFKQERLKEVDGIIKKLKEYRRQR